MDSKQHMENVLDTKIRPIFEKARIRIEALQPGQKIPATQLAADLAKEIGMTGPQLYPVILFLIKDYPGVEVKKGAHGGVQRMPLPSTVATLPLAKPTADDNDVATPTDNKDAQ